MRADSRSPLEIIKGASPIAVFLFMLSFGLFLPSLDYEFLNYDDNAYVFQNPAVLQGLNSSSLKYAFTTYDIGTWAPVTWLSYKADTSVLGARPSSYRLTNIVLHCLAGVALFLALRLMLGSLPLSLVIAGLFLLHPLRTDSVVWISERKDVLCAFFWALGLLAYWFYANRPDLTRWLLVFLCFAFGCLSKMMMVTFPFTLLLLDLWPLNRIELASLSLARLWKLIREKIPMFLLCLPVIGLNTAALNVKGTLHPDPAGIFVQSLRVPINYCFYLGKIIWPSNRALLYPIHDVKISVVILSSLLLLVISLATIWHMRRKPWLFVGWFWFLGTLIPVIGFVKLGYFNVEDRYSYIPSIGLMLAVVVGLYHLFGKYSKTLAALAILTLVSYAVALEADLPRWKNSFELFDAALKVGPHYISYTNRGIAYLNRNEPQMALQDFNSAIQLNPDYAGAYNDRANVYIGYQQYTNAIEDLNHAIALKPDGAPFYGSRAAAYFFLKQYPQAQADLDECRRLGGYPQPALVEALSAAFNSSTNSQ